jgi:hypothetical protein
MVRRLDGLQERTASYSRRRIKHRNVRFLAFPVFQRGGAPEEIRTPDPQIRSLRQNAEIARDSCKPASFEDTTDQRVRCACANRERPPDPPASSPGPVRAGTGANSKPQKWTAENTKRNVVPQAVEHHSFVDTHGQVSDGCIEQQGRSFIRDRERLRLGSFRDGNLTDDPSPPASGGVS